jgi:rhodanese-related sulfurtransferase
MSVQTVIGPLKLSLLRKETDIILVDVRSPEEFAESHIPGSVNIPLQYIDDCGAALSSISDLVLVCRSGKRALQARDLLYKHGFESKVLEGGIKNWRNNSLPVNGSQAQLPIEQQVRVATGLLVLASLSLSLWLGPWWLLLAAFVGAGLTFAGVTGNCGLAILLSKCPWNSKSLQPGSHGDGGNLSPGNHSQD